MVIHGSALRHYSRQCSGTIEDRNRPGVAPTVLSLGPDPLLLSCLKVLDKSLWTSDSPQSWVTMGQMIPSLGNTWVGAAPP